MKRISEPLIRDEIEFAARFNEQRVRRLRLAIGPIKIGGKTLYHGSPDVSALNKSRNFHVPSDFGFADMINVMGPPDKTLVSPMSSFRHRERMFGNSRSRSQECARRENQ